MGCTSRLSCACPKPPGQIMLPENNAQLVLTSHFVLPTTSQNQSRVALLTQYGESKNEKNPFHLNID
jgi:hypothetical protein